MAILDTDFLSSFFKIGKLKLVLKVLNVKHVVVPSTVYEELKEAKFFNEISSLFAFNEKELNENRFILVKTVDLIELKENLTPINLFLHQRSLRVRHALNSNYLVAVDDAFLNAKLYRFPADKINTISISHEVTNLLALFLLTLVEITAQIQLPVFLGKNLA